MKWFFIRPFDTLFFRDARPFVAGEDNLAQSLFPPAPSVTYGALRTASLIHAGVDLIKFKEGNAENVAAAAGNNTGLGTLYLIGPIPARRRAGTVELLFLSPLNLVYKDESRAHNLEFLLPDLSANNSHTNLPLTLNFCMANEKVAYTDCYLSFDQALALCAGNVPNKKEDLIKREDFWKLDHRVGIARTKARTAEEGMLYSSCHIQIDNHPRNIDQEGGLAVKVLEGKDDLPQKSIIQLGGEKRFCGLEEISLDQPTKFQITKVAKKISETQRFFLWLLSPAVFCHREFAYIPGFINPDTLIGEFDGHKVKLVGCHVGRAVSIGGWNIADNTPKPMRRAVPAGSIYFFGLNKQISENMAEFVGKWMLHTIPGQMPDYDKQGFGTILIGGY